MSIMHPRPPSRVLTRVQSDLCWARRHRGGIVPIRSQIVRLPVAGLAVSAVALLLTAAALAADPEAFLAGTSRNCVECDFAGRDLKARDFKRAKLDRASFKNADLA